MGIVTEYLKYQEEYQEKYGNRTVVFYQNGSFFEIFEYDPEKDKTGQKHPWPTKRLGHAVYLSSLLGFTLTKRNKSKPYSLSNPNMIGFNCISYEKYKDLILSKDYTIVVVEQELPGKNATRHVTKVLSPATQIVDLNPIPVTNQIVSIYIEVQKEMPKLEDYLIAVGISTIDVTTGNNIAGEIYSKQKDAVYGLQEIYRFLLSVQPRELIIHINDVKKDLAEKYRNYIIQTLELNKYPIYIIKVNETEKEYLKSNYHQQFLSKIFRSETNNHQKNPKSPKSEGKEIVLFESSGIIEELGMERIHYGTISYILLLQYCYEHDERLLEKLKHPDTHWIDEAKHLVITHNGVKQMDILPPVGSDRLNRSGRTNDINSLFSVVNNTSTALGKRFLLNMLSNPITNPNLITEYYNMTEDLVNNSTLLSSIEDLLKKIPDIERYQRKLQLRIIQPREFVILFRAYISIVKLYTLILQSETRLKGVLFPQVSSFNQCLTNVLSRYNLDVLSEARIDNDAMVTDGNIFYQKADPAADQYYCKIHQLKTRIDKIVEHLNAHLTKTRGKLIEFTRTKKSKTGPDRNLALFTTIYKGSILKSAPIDSALCGNVQIITVNKEAMITSDLIAGACQNLITCEKEYNQYLYRCYNQTVNDISNSCNFFNSINLFVSKLDYIKSNSKTAIKNKYLRPEILGDMTDVSYMDMKNLRHPISEKIITGEFVTNDIVLGSKPYGILLYGANSVGKSTLTKAVGLNIIMAQAGMFVPSELKYSPYKKIITRLSGEDSLIQNKSSFVVEMSELRTILRNADSGTLVLGDELCRGTESISGPAIAVKAITELIERKTSFIFSTHIHLLAEDPDVVKVQKNDCLRICHMVLYCDRSTGTLVYDRKLKEGTGDPVYGLEVARSLGIEPEFIRGAEEIRKRFLNQSVQFLSTHKSRHNKNVYMDSCAICKKRSNTKGVLITHHKKEQHTADENGFIKYHHKDSADNLLVLCEPCHKSLHANGLKVITKETPSGRIVKIPLNGVTI